MAPKHATRSSVLWAAGIHPTAQIASDVILGEGVSIGPYAVIESGAVIGDRCRIYAHAYIGPHTTLGADCVVYPHASVGSDSQDLKYIAGSPTYLTLGQGNKIREFVTINRATAEGQSTSIGDHNLFMAYAHVAHDCQIGHHNVFANQATLGGHVQIENHVIIGAMTGIHQFVHIGEMSMVGAMSRICQDMPPFMLVVGHPPKMYGVNAVGLQRQSIPRESIRGLKKAYHILYRQKMSLPNAIQAIKALSPNPELDRLIHFIQQSKRGLVG